MYLPTGLPGRLNTGRMQLLRAKEKPWEGPEEDKSLSHSCSPASPFSSPLPPRLQAIASHSNPKHFPLPETSLGRLWVFPPQQTEDGSPSGVPQTTPPTGQTSVCTGPGPCHRCESIPGKSDRTPDPSGLKELTLSLCILCGPDSTTFPPPAP